VLDRDIRLNQEKREKIESVFDLINSVREAGSSSFEKEIEVLDAFSEVRTTVAESRAELMRNDIRLCQLYISSDQVSRMQSQIEDMKQSVMRIDGILPANEETRGSTTSSVPVKRKVASSGPTQNDLFLMSAIEDALRSS
jgi:hypothetical protein